MVTIEQLEKMREEMEKKYVEQVEKMREEMENLKKERRKEERKGKEKEETEFTIRIGENKEKGEKGNPGSEEDTSDTERERRREKKKIKEKDKRKRSSSSEEEDNEKEKSKKRRRKKKKKERIELPDVKEKDKPKEEDIRRYVQKVKEKIEAKEDIEDIRRDISSTLEGTAYDVYRTEVDKYRKKGGEIKKGSDLNQVLDKMLESYALNRGWIAKRREVMRQGQKEDETIMMWGNRVEQELKQTEEEGKMDDEVAQLMIVEAFIAGLKDEEVRIKMKVMEAKKELTMEKAKEKAEACRIELEVLEEEGRKRNRPKEEEGRSIAPVSGGYGGGYERDYRRNNENWEYGGIRNYEGGYGRREEQQRGRGRYGYERGGRGESYGRRGQQGNRGGSRNIGNRDDTCYNCHQQGHRSFECSNRVACNKCGRQGHKAVECLADVPCGVCGRPGHRTDDCWEKNKNANRGGRGRGGWRGRGGRGRGGYGQPRGGMEAERGREKVGGAEGDLDVKVQISNNKEGEPYECAL